LIGWAFELKPDCTVAYNGTGPERFPLAILSQPAAARPGNDSL